MNAPLKTCCNNFFLIKFLNCNCFFITVNENSKMKVDKKKSNRANSNGDSEGNVFILCVYYIIYL